MCTSILEPDLAASLRLSLATHKAARQCGGSDTYEALHDIAVELSKYKKASAADDMIDADNNGVADVEEITGAARGVFLEFNSDTSAHRRPAREAQTRRVPQGDGPARPRQGLQRSVRSGVFREPHAMSATCDSAGIPPGSPCSPF